MNYTDFVTGNYKNEPTSTFFDYFGLPNTTGNVFDMTEHHWFAGNHKTLPEGMKRKTKIHFNSKHGWNHFDKIVFGKDFTVGVEKTSDGHCFFSVYDNQKYKWFLLER